MAKRLQRMKPLHPDMSAAVPPGAEPFGLTPDGKQLYREVRRMAVTEWATDEEGKQKWKKNQMTGEPLIPVRKVKEIKEEVLIYYLESQGNGNIGRVPYQPPSDEELAAVQRAQKVAEAQSDLAEALVDSGMDPKDLIAQLRGSVPPSLTPPPVNEFEELKAPERENRDVEEGETVEPEPPVQEYPYMSSPGMWTLSNGDRVRGNRAKAVKAERALAQAEVEGTDEETPTPEF